MEGLRAAPWFREMSRRGSLGISDCTACKERNTPLVRQHMGCGYEPPIEHGPVWSPPLKFSPGEPLTTCAGFTVNLPEVTEACLARAHWKHGALREWLAGDEPTDELMNAILIVDASYSQVEQWAMTAAKDGGGREE